LAENGIKESGELPDHLIHILPLLGRMVPPEAAERLARDCVGRAVRQMVSALQEASNPFLPVIECIESVLVSCWGSIPDGLPVQSSAEPGREDFV
jgi:nitrate reductase assembly molybdenum cofactor insertion protein NarJ